MVGKKQFWSSGNTCLLFLTQNVLYKTAFASFFTGFFFSQDHGEQGCPHQRGEGECAGMDGGVLVSKGGTDTADYFDFITLLISVIIL